MSVEVRSKDGPALCYTLIDTSGGGAGDGTFKVQMGFPPPSSASDAQIVIVNQKDTYNVVSVPVTISSKLPPIVVDSPACGTMVKSPVIVQGTMSSDMSEGDVVVVAKDAQGLELGRSTVTADMHDAAGSAGRADFTASLSFSMPALSPTVGYHGAIEAFGTSPKDGSAVFLFSVPVDFRPAVPQR